MAALITGLLSFVSVVVTMLSGAVVYLWRQNVEQIKQNTQILLAEQNCTHRLDTVLSELAETKETLVEYKRLQADLHEENKETLTQIKKAVNGGAH